MGLPTRRRSAGPGDRGADERQEAAGHRQCRNQHHGGDAEPLARLRKRRDGQGDQLWDLSPTFMAEDGRLRPQFAKRGIKLGRSVDPEITYAYFNMLDKIGDRPNPVGGYSREKIALRRAIAMA